MRSMIRADDGKIMILNLKWTLRNASVLDRRRYQNIGTLLGVAQFRKTNILPSLDTPP